MMHRYPLPARMKGRFRTNPMRKVENLSEAEKQEAKERTREWISEALADMLRHAPFYCKILMRFRYIRPNFASETAWVILNGEKVDLEVNPLFFEQLTKEERAGVMLHEVLHGVFRHLFRMPDGCDHEVHNLATDIVCNDYIVRWNKTKDGVPVLESRAEHCMLPAACFTRHSFSDIRVPEDPSSDDIYDQLMAKKQQALALGPLKPGEGIVSPPADASNRDGLDIPCYGYDAVTFFRHSIPKNKDGKSKDGKSKDGKPGQGSGGGAPQPGEGHPEPGDNQDPRSIGGHSNHSKWGEQKENGGKEWKPAEGEPKPGEPGSGVKNADMTDATLEDIILRAGNELTPDQFAKLPGAFQREIARIREARKPAMNWKAVLRQFMNTAGSTRLVSTERRESKRYEGSSGTKIKTKRKILVAVDTSGSMSPAIVARLMAEVDHIARAADVHVVLFTGEVYDHFKYSKSVDYASRMKTGGTDFDPIFKWSLNKSFDAIVVLTDGFAATPTFKPRCKVLWVLIKKDQMGKKDALPWGPHLYMPVEDLAKPNSSRRLVAQENPLHAIIEVERDIHRELARERR